MRNPVLLRRRRAEAVCSPPSSMEDLRRREGIRQLVQRHEECKAAFQELKSQIQVGLTEAKEVFDSLSAPLMTLVGIKSQEMAEEGRSSSVLVNRDVAVPEENRSGSRGSPFQGIGLQKRSDAGRRRRRSNYSARAREECAELQDKQGKNVACLVQLLRAMGHRVSSHQDSMFHALESHRGSLQSLLTKSASFLSTSQPRNANVAASFTVQILKAAFGYVGEALHAVEDDVRSLLRALAEDVCAPIVEHVKGLRLEAQSGPAARLVWLVGEMEEELREQGEAVEELERALGEARGEVEGARKKARVEEEEKAEAERLGKEYREKFRGMKEFVRRIFLESQQQQQQHIGRELVMPPGDKRGETESSCGSDAEGRELAIARRLARRSCTGNVAQLTPSPSAVPSLSLMPRSAPPSRPPRRAAITKGKRNHGASAHNLW